MTETPIMRSSVWLAIAASVFVAVPALARCGGPPQPEDMAAAKAAALAQADTDGDGALSVSEFPAFEEAMHRGRAEAHFACLDANGDGKVTAEELEQAGPHRPPPPRF